MLILKVNVKKNQSDAEQGSVDLADFHITYTVFRADSRGAIRFSKIFIATVLFVPPV